MKCHLEPSPSQETQSKDLQLVFAVVPVSASSFSVSERTVAVVAVIVAPAVASRYPRALALGLSIEQQTRGFNPWGMLSYPIQSI
jgi:hypothetical protein